MFLYPTKSQTGTETFEESEIPEPRYPFILIDNYRLKLIYVSCGGGVKPNGA